MHEFSLYGQVVQEDHHRMLQQLAGYTRMQPRDVVELHLVFKARPPAGLDNIPSAGGSQGVAQQQDVQKLKNMLNASLYYVQLVGEVMPTRSKKRGDEDVEMTNGNGPPTSDNPTVRWALEFKDTPDAGKQAVSTRLISRTPMDDGDLVQFLDHFGYEYVCWYSSYHIHC